MRWVTRGGRFSSGWGGSKKIFVAVWGIESLALTITEVAGSIDNFLPLGMLKNK